VKQPHIVLAITLAVPGGTTSFVFQYAFWLKQKGFNVTVLAGEGTWLFDRCEEVEIRCLSVPFLQREIRPWLDLPALFSLTQLLRTLKPDVIHLNSSKMGVLGSIAARLAHVPRVIYFIGGWAFLESIASWKKSIYLHAERWTARFKDRIVCLHPADKAIAEAQQIKPRQGITVIPNGVDLPFLDRTRLSRAEARQILGIPQDRFIFGTIANFFSTKNLPAYIKTAAPVIQASPAAGIVIIGEGVERPLIEQAIQETNLGDQILLTGTQEQAHRFLSAFDVFVLPSTKEGMPFSTLEAMAARLPCLVTDVGAHRWMLEGTGSWIVPKEQPLALQKALQETLEKRGRLVDVGQANRLVIERRFPLETTFETHRNTCLPT